MKKGNERKNRVEFDYLGRAVNDRLFTGAIPLLFDAGAFACYVSTLGRPLLFNQPGELRLLCVHHIDAKLSADTRSTYDNHPQESHPQAIQRPQPPSNWITGVRHYARLTKYEQI